MTTIRALLVKAIAAVALLLPALAVQPANAQTALQPHLQLTSPFSGVPQALDGDASGNFLVTSASSRILTLWTRFGEGQWEPRAIHAPVRDEFASGTYLSAISPDGAFLAFAVPPLSDGQGGFVMGTARIYMIERLSQQIVQTFSAGVPTRITRLKFSPDGNHLAAGLGQGCGVRLWSRKQWTTPERDLGPAWSDDEGYAGDNGARCCPGPTSSACESLPNATDVIFTGRTDDGPWMATLSENGLRTYALNGETPVRTSYVSSEAMALLRPGKMALSPDGAKLVVGDVWAPNLAVLERSGAGYRPSTRLTVPDAWLTDKGKAQASPSVGGIYLPNPVWAESGGKLLLYAFGYLPRKLFLDGKPDSDANGFLVFDLERNDVRYGALGDDIDASLYTAQRGEAGARQIYFVSTHALSVVAPGSLEARRIAVRAALDLRGNNFKDWRLMLSRQDRKVFVTTAAGDEKFLALEFDFDAFTLTGPLSYDTLSKLHAAIDAHAATYSDAEANKDDWRFNLRIGAEPRPKFFGKTLSLDRLYPNEVSYSGAKLPNADTIVWGTSRALRLIDGQGAIVCTRPIESPALRMNVTADGRMVVVAHGDGSIRWYGAGASPSCLPPIASLYLSQNADGSWGFLAWLPNGKFMTAGGAALKSLACYPKGPAGVLTPCIDFQETDALYSPEDMRQALSAAAAGQAPPGTATGDAGLTAILAEKPDNQLAAVDLSARTEWSNPTLPVTLTFTNLNGSTKYLTLSAGNDLSFTVDGQTYSRTRPFPIEGRQMLKVVANLPPALQHAKPLIKICPEVFSRLGSDGAVEPSSRQALEVGHPCALTAWTGIEADPTQKKLWALLIGLSRAPNDIAPLRFAHQDAINLARFLQLDHDRILPGKSHFDDVEIRLLVAPPEKDAALDQDPHIQRLQTELGDQGLRMIYKPDTTTLYDTLVRSALKDLIENGINNPNRSDRADWQDVVLVYFSGHGFSKLLPGTPSHLQVGLITPDANRDLTQGVVWLDTDLMTPLRDNNLAGLIILDACSAQLDVPGVRPLSAEEAMLKLSYPSSGVDYAGLKFYFANEIGTYSYEQSDYSIADFVPNLQFWPDDAKSRGSGLFSLGFLASLLCQEAEDEQSFTPDSSSKFLKKYFFNNSNTKLNAIKPKLMTSLGSQFIPPAPVTFCHSSCSNDPAINALRTAAQNEPKCDFAAKTH